MSARSTMQVRDVMSTPAVTVGVRCPVKQATQLLAHHDIAALPVLDQHGVLVGVLSEADVIEDAYLGDDPVQPLPRHEATRHRGVVVGDVMSTHPITVPADAAVAQAVDLMVGTAVKSLPVVDGGRVVGMISRRDLVRLLARPDALVEAEVDEVLRRAGLEASVEVDDGIVWVDDQLGEAEAGQVWELVAPVLGVVGVRVRAALAPRPR